MPVAPDTRRPSPVRQRAEVAAVLRRVLAAVEAGDLVAGPLLLAGLAGALAALPHATSPARRRTPA